MMERLANEPTLRRKLGEAGRARAIRYFSPVDLAKELTAFYNTLLSS